METPQCSCRVGSLEIPAKLPYSKDMGLVQLKVHSKRYHSQGGKRYRRDIPLHSHAVWAKGRALSGPCTIKTEWLVGSKPHIGTGIFDHAHFQFATFFFSFYFKFFVLCGEIYSE